MKQYSFLLESLDNDHESVIKDNVVYHVKPNKMEEETFCEYLANSIVKQKSKNDSISIK